MIKLTLTPHTQPITYIFEKDCILIGKNSYPEVVADLIISYTEDKSVYVKIELIKENFVAYNIAEDPFITINKFPFNKKTLKTGDFLQIGSLDIKFEGILGAQCQNLALESPPDEDVSLVDLLAEKMENTYAKEPLFTSPLPNSSGDKNKTHTLDLDSAMLELEEFLKSAEIKNQISNVPLNNDDDFLLPISIPLNKYENTPVSVSPQKFLSEEELEALFSELDSFDEVIPHTLALTSPLLEVKINEDVIETDSPDSESESAPILETQNKQLRSKSMKDDYSAEGDEGISHRRENSTNGEKTISISWKMFFSALGGLLLLALIVSSSLYFAISGRNEEEEIKAAQAVADVAMALNSALINHAQPQNHNWSDQNFLKHTLTAVLAPPYQPFVNIDSHGHFKNTSYILRIYTGDDLNHFLIIAQPRPSLLQWIMPKAAITVDSSFMELRKITDLKTLNRLLINAKLDTSNSTNVANLVKLGELIPLSTLRKDHPHSGFDLPRALGFIRPGAENLIYNGIRYYPLGESLMKKAIAIYDNEENGHDLIPLIDEISLFTRFPDIILYSSEGMQMAQRGNKALATFFPHYKFLYGYLQFNQQNFAHRSTLLIDDNDDRMVATATIEHQEPLDNLEMENADTRVDKQHPLYYKLIALYNENEQALKPIRDKINLEKINPQWDSQRKLAALQINYEMLSQKIHEKIMQTIVDLQLENSSMPFSQFMNYIKATKTESTLEKNLQMRLPTEEQSLRTSEIIKKKIEKIKTSTSIKELDHNLIKTSLLLTLEAIPDPKLIIAFQTEIHSNVIHKLDALLLHPDTPLPPAEPDDRDALSHILKTAWVTDEGEFDYYLHEYDLLYK